MCVRARVCSREICHTSAREWGEGGDLGVNGGRDAVTLSDLLPLTPPSNDPSPFLPPYLSTPLSMHIHFLAKK